jgi:hypothetical protein
MHHPRTVLIVPERCNIMLFRKCLVDSDGNLGSAFRICVRAYQVLKEVVSVVFVTAVTVLATPGVELV